MISDIKFLFKEDRVDIQIFGGYDDFVDHMFQYTEQEERVCDPIDSAADCLRHWAIFDKEDSKNSSLSKKELEKLMRDAYPTANQTIKKVKIGRNDPCPPLSGHSGRITASLRRLSVRLRAKARRYSVSSDRRISRALSTQHKLSSHAVSGSRWENSAAA